MSDQRDFVDALARRLADEGKLIEAGWVALKALVVPPTAPETQIEDMRMAYFAGAQHLFASILTILEPGAEPSDQDLERMDLINDELATFAKEEFDRRMQQAGKRDGRKPT